MPAGSSRRSFLGACVLLFASPAAAQTRWRNMSVDTVAGRQVRFVNGAHTNYHRDGRLDGRLPDGTEFRGRWEIGSTNLFAGNPQSIRVILDTGDTLNTYYLQDGDAIFLVRRSLRQKKGEIRARVRSIGAI